MDLQSQRLGHDPFVDKPVESKLQGGKYMKFPKPTPNKYPGSDADQKNKTNGKENLNKGSRAEYESCNSGNKIFIKHIRRTSAFEKKSFLIIQEPFVERKPYKKEEVSPDRPKMITNIKPDTLFARCKDIRFLHYPAVIGDSNITNLKIYPNTCKDEITNILRPQKFTCSVPKRAKPPQPKFLKNGIRNQPAVNIFKRQDSLLDKELDLELPFINVRKPDADQSF